MALPMVKSTYVLDVETADRLDRLAKEWRVSKSEALRRVIRSVSAAGAPDRVALFRQLQGEVNLSRTKATTWAESVGAERRASRTGTRKTR